MATQQKLRGDWNSVVGSVKEKYGQITDDELTEVEGNTDQLLGLIQQKTGETREQIEKALNKCMASTSESLKQNYQHAVEGVREGYQQSTEAISQRPMESVLAAFGIGLLTGIAIGYSLSGSRAPEPTWRDRWVG